ncbi:hypothetical protein HDV01_005265 [Terramyces sp. JEL0728]|nr:hypothetical protein HDV01_005265 [Terramyces sp. JEL0728]
MELKKLIEEVGGQSPVETVVDSSVEVEKVSGKRKGEELPSMLYINKPKTFKPDTDILSRVQTFLPQLEQSNNELQEKIKQNIDVNLENVDGKHIQMDLECGVFDMKEGNYQYDSTLVQEEEEYKLRLGNERQVEIQEIQQEKEEEEYEDDDYESESEQDNGSEYEQSESEYEPDGDYSD